MSRLEEPFGTAEVLEAIDTHGRVDLEDLEKLSGIDRDAIQGCLVYLLRLDVLEVDEHRVTGVERVQRVQDAQILKRLATERRHGLTFDRLLEQLAPAWASIPPSHHPLSLSLALERMVRQGRVERLDQRHYRSREIVAARHKDKTHDPHASQRPDESPPSGGQEQ